MPRLEQLRQNPIQQLKLPGSPHNLLIDSAPNRKVLVHLTEYERVITDFTQLHEGVLQVGLTARFAKSGQHDILCKSPAVHCHILCAPMRKLGTARRMNVTHPTALISIGNVLYFCTLSYSFHCRLLIRV